MSSENEIINQPGDDQPDNNTEEQPVEPIVEQETAVVPPLSPKGEIPQSEPESMAETVSKSGDDNLGEEEMDWDSWLLTNPEVEEVVPVVVPDEALDSNLLGEEAVSDPAPLEANDIEVDLAEVIIAEFEEKELVEIVEAEEELVELLAEVDEIDAAVDAEVQADALETVAEAIAEAEIVAEHIPDKAIETAQPQPEEPIVEAPVPSPAKPKKPRKHPQGLTVKDVVRYFAPCGRCGYFLTGYRAMNGEKNFEEAVLLEKDGWLMLSWSHDIRELILKSYGRVVEANDLLFSRACPECSRVMDYYAPVDDNDRPVTFRVEVKPQSGK